MLEIVAKRQFGGCFGKKSEQTSVVCGFREHFLGAEKALVPNYAPVLHKQLTVFIRYKIIQKKMLIRLVDNLHRLVFSSFWIQVRLFGSEPASERG